MDKEKELMKDHLKTFYNFYKEVSTEGIYTGISEKESEAIEYVKLLIKEDESLKYIIVNGDGTFTIECNSIQEATYIWDNLLNLIYDYGEATISDLHAMMGIVSTFGEYNKTWKDLIQGVSITRVKSGILLNLPKPLNIVNTSQEKLML